MEKEFAPYDLALRLKALGFDKLCFGWYFTDQTDKVQMQNCHNSCGWLRGNNCSAPTYSQVFRWFREKYNIDSFCRQTSLDGTSYWKINRIESDEVIKGYSGFTTSYSEAELTCLNKLLEIVESRIELPDMVIYTENLTAEEVLEKYGKVLTEEQIAVLNDTKKKTNG